MFNQLKFLIALLLLLIGLVYHVMQAKQNQLYDGEQLLLPQLQDDSLMVAIDKIEFKHGEQGFFLNKRQGGWLVNDGFYADMEPLIELVQSLQNGKKQEAKTNNPKNFKRLQIADDDWTLQVFAKNQKIAALHLGKSGYAADTLFIRMVGESQSWLVTEFKPLDHDIHHWQLKNVLHVAPEQIESLAIKHRNGERLLFEKDRHSGQLQLQNQAADALPNDMDWLTLTANLASGLSHFIIERAEPNQFKTDNYQTELEYQLLNGETLIIKLFQTAQDGYWAVIDSDKYRNWQLKIPEFKFKLFSQTIPEPTQE